MADSSPCKGCADRELGCHGKCKRYIAFKKKREDILQHNAKESMLLGESVRRMKTHARY